MKKSFLTKTLAIALAFSPALAFAADSVCPTATDLASVFYYALCLLVAYVTPFLFAVGALIFIIGVLNYVRAGDDIEKRAAGRDLMWFGIIALFVMIAVWGFVNILSTSIFGAGKYGSNLPNLPPQATSIFGQQ